MLFYLAVNLTKIWELGWVLSNSCLISSFSAPISCGFKTFLLPSQAVRWVSALGLCIYLCKCQINWNKSSQSPFMPYLNSGTVVKRAREDSSQETNFFIRSAYRLWWNWWSRRMSVEPKILTWHFPELEMTKTALDPERIFIFLELLYQFQLLLLAFLI